MVSVFNRLKNKELITASGQESVVLADEVEKLGNCLHRGVNFPELSYLSCARQVAMMVNKIDRPNTTPKARAICRFAIYFRSFDLFIASPFMKGISYCVIRRKLELLIRSC